jgi:hypothetical protein
LPRRALAQALIPFLLAGCAGLSGPASEPPALPGWSIELADLLPAINACMVKADGTASGVTRAWSMARSLAGVRVLREDGSRVDCVASGKGDQVVLVQPVLAGSRLSDEAAPLYTPPDHSPPEGRCIATVPAVVSARQVGWLSYGTCHASGQPQAPSQRPRSAPLPPSV